MRVISGQAKGHKLKAPQGISTRPTTDKIKESLFSMLFPYLDGCDFLDLFSGSGGIGIEALSRGAARCVFVDNKGTCKRVIEENLKFTKLYEKANVLKMNAVAAIESLGNEGMKFDIIFLDPPYEGGFIQEALSSILKSGILNEKGIIVVERASQIPLPALEGLEVFKERNFKTTVMAFLRLSDN